MIEGPEAVTIARQLAESVAGRRIIGVERGNTPHKFAFYSGTPEWYYQTMTGKRLGAATARGMVILLPTGDEHVLVLGCGGEHIPQHPPGAGMRVRHQLRLALDEVREISATLQE